MTPGLPTYRIHGLGLAASVAVGAATLLYLPGALFPIVGLSVAQTAAARHDRDLVAAAALGEALLTLPYLLALLVAAVLVIIWTWRVRKNIEAFPGALPSLNPGWAIAGWLVPFANFVVPARMLANVARDSLWRARTPALVGLWWTAWLLFNLADNVVARIDDRRYASLTVLPRNDAEFATYVRYYQETIGPRLIPTLACLVAGVSLIVLIRRISAAQRDRLSKALPGWPAHPGWPVPGMQVPPVPPASVQPVTGWSPQVAASESVASPPETRPSGGTIGA
ncbi:DUF4328 domain-containing protein [Micromonospora musae]|uniref:DUF4328 domain-containing protein n=1 Tax=Micromonospora musae TaxID=1894970 RepID=UPI0033D9D18A